MLIHEKNDTNKSHATVPLIAGSKIYKHREELLSPQEKSSEKLNVDRQVNMYVPHKVYEKSLKTSLYD